MIAATRVGDEIQEGEEGRERGGRTSSPLNKNESQNPEGERLVPERSRAQVRRVFMANHDPDYGLRQIDFDILGPGYPRGGGLARE